MADPNAFDVVGHVAGVEQRSSGYVASRQQRAERGGDLSTQLAIEAEALRLCAMDCRAYLRSTGLDEISPRFGECPGGGDCSPADRAAFLPKAEAALRERMTGVVQELPAKPDVLDHMRAVHAISDSLEPAESPDAGHLQHDRLAMIGLQMQDDPVGAMKRLEAVAEVQRQGAEQLRHTAEAAGARLDQHTAEALDHHAQRALGAAVRQAAVAGLTNAQCDAILAQTGFAMVHPVGRWPGYPDREKPTNRDRVRAIFAAAIAELVKP